jgi:hypothetical protein
LYSTSTLNSINIHQIKANQGIFYFACTSAEVRSMFFVGNTGNMFKSSVGAIQFHECHFSADFEAKIGGGFLGTGNAFDCVATLAVRVGDCGAGGRTVEVHRRERSSSLSFSFVLLLGSPLEGLRTQSLS